MDPIRTAIIFDIETAPQPADVLESQIPAFDPSEVKTGNLKDPALIAAKIAQAEERHRTDFFDRAALSPATGQVAAIGIVIKQFDQDDTQIVSSEATVFADQAGGEAQAIQHLWDIVRQFATKRSTFIGHNIYDFDLPFLVNRSRILDVKLPPGLFQYSRQRIYFTDQFVDTRTLWLMGRKPSDSPSSLDHCCSAFGLGQKNGSGKDFARMLVEDRTKAEEYLRNDLKLTFDLARRMGAC